LGLVVALFMVGAFFDWQGHPLSLTGLERFVRLEVVFSLSAKTLAKV
jgi:hypothetical protein